MNDPNKHNLQYFKNASMRGLYDDMENWQATKQKRLLSTSIQKDGDMFCCVTLSNPSEVIICGGENHLDQVVVNNGALHVGSDIGKTHVF